MEKATNKISEKYSQIFASIIAMYEGQKIELNFETPFQLLCAVILSAQTTDKQVNKITPPLFERIKQPNDMFDITLKEIENHLQYINFFRNKSHYIWETGKILTARFGGEIPNDIKLLQTLPGVGIKTAKVVLGVLYDAPFVGVDTHIHRVMNRIGFVKTKTPQETDKIIEKKLPEILKRKLHHPLVLFGRYHCKAKNPLCSTCSIKDLCPTGKKIS